MTFWPCVSSPSWAHNLRKRADLVGFVNGLPLVFVEFKSPLVKLDEAIKGNYEDYLHTIPRLFDWNALVVVSNGSDAQYAALGAAREHFYRCKRLNEGDAAPAASAALLPLLLHGMLDKARLQSPSAQVQAEVAAGKLGVFWHTQGSGKSYSMVFLSEKIRRKVSAAYTFVIVTDRTELDDQIAQTYARCGLANTATQQASSGEDLRKKLKDASAGYVFTLIQKYNEHVRPDAPYSTRGDIIVISDEAHRSNYGQFALNMRTGLPGAKFLAFTGTPLMDGADEITRKIFGPYVSVYDFQHAVDDHATVPLTYENRGEQLGITDEALNKRIAQQIKAERRKAAPKASPGTMRWKRPSTARCTATTPCSRPASASRKSPATLWSISLAVATPSMAARAKPCWCGSTKSPACACTS